MLMQIQSRFYGSGTEPSWDLLSTPGNQCIPWRVHREGKGDESVLTLFGADWEAVSIFV